MTKRIIIYKGIIAFLSEKGYGFIRPYDAPKRINIYFHVTSVKKAGGIFNNLTVGDPIGYSNVVKTERGQIANKVYIDYE